MNLSDKHIAILGGMGPQASALLQVKIVKALNDAGVLECQAFPLISQISLPVKDFISNPAGRFRNTRMIEEALRALQHKKIDQLIVACNTAHLLFDEIKDFDGLPVISLPDSVINQALDEDVQRLGLLASPTTIKTKLFEARTKGALDILVPSDKEQKELEMVIRRTIAGQNDSHDLAVVNRLVQQLIVDGAEKVALGCTELSVAAKDIRDKRVIDSLDASTKTLIESLLVQKVAVVR